MLSQEWASKKNHCQWYPNHWNCFGKLVLVEVRQNLCRLNLALIRDWRVMTCICTWMTSSPVLRRVVAFKFKILKWNIKILVFLPAVSGMVLRWPTSFIISSFSLFNLLTTLTTFTSFKTSFNICFKTFFETSLKIQFQTQFPNLVSKLVSKPVLKPVSNPVSEPVLKQVSKPVSNPVLKSSFKPSFKI